MSCPEIALHQPTLNPMPSAFLQLTCPTPDPPSRQMRLEACRTLEAWAHQNDYTFRNLYPGKHGPYQNPMSVKPGPLPDTFDYPLTWLLLEGAGAYEHVSGALGLLLPDPGIQVTLMRWTEEDGEGAPAPQDVEMQVFRMPWEHAQASRGEMALRLIYRPDPTAAVECCAGRSLAQNVETARQMLRSLLFHRGILS